MKSRSLKNKGKNFQNAVRDLVLEVFTELEPDDVRSTTMGDSGEDLKLSPAARKKLPLSFECKKTRKHPAKAEMEQSRYHVKDKPGIVPVVCWSPHGSGIEHAMITFNLRDFLVWYKNLEKSTNG